MGRSRSYLLGWWAVGCVLFLAACQATRSRPEGKLQVVATTSIVADLARQLGGEAVQVVALMGPGIDPHLYRASEGDVARMQQADLILYNGLHLEGKMAEVFARMQALGRPTLAVAECIPDSLRLTASGFGGTYDPHVWMDVRRWQHAARCVAETFARIDTGRAAIYQERLQAYLIEMEQTDAYVRQRSAELPSDHRVLVTSHDAFRYFADAYGWEVRGLLGVSTASEAGAADVQMLADFIVAKRLPAIFVESSVPERYLKALQEAVAARGHTVRLAGPLYSDALGDPQTPAGTYTGMVRTNIDTIIEALRTAQTP
ncbi:metal ABC transporter solute-binding protein, Zn/Mn family [Rhodothermus bifroesti]|uniref:Manganese transporter n=1 Tax=Rhodothermus marinus TaxID=29549 RepID=A0A7V2B0Q8_RHOMR|nr:zinc ABC transporter substrate-binding protein [Rhodothermus bifroesti]GBD00601.1 Periplasmic zinc-binding protein TroA [bacterium HR18]